MEELKDLIALIRADRFICFDLASCEDVIEEVICRAGEELSQVAAFLLSGTVSQPMDKVGLIAPLRGGVVVGHGSRVPFSNPAKVESWVTDLKITFPCFFSLL